jgi:hypothetical protein
MNLVWGGFYVMMAGGLLALVKRTREAKRAVVPATEASREPQPTSAVSIPVTARTRLSTET